MGELNKRLTKERKRLGLNQQQLADKLGISKTTQFNYEKGTRTPDALYLAQLAQLGGDVLFVVTGHAQVDLPGSSQGALLEKIGFLNDKDREAIAHLVEALGARR